MVTRMLIGLVFALAVAGCNKNEPVLGCTDCQAINYHVNAEKDNNSCIYINNDLLGVYAVKDSIFGPPVPEWNHRSYDIEISRDSCGPDRLVITNYSNKDNFSGPFSVGFLAANGTIVIPEQGIGDDNVRTSVGYFASDSIYFAFEFENEFGEVFSGDCYGKKK